MNASNINDFRHNVHCRECAAGVMHVRYITYFTWLGDELIMAPNFPAWVCDFCGKREYDERAVNRLSMLLDPQAGKPFRSASHKHPTDLPPRDFPSPGHRDS